MRFNANIQSRLTVLTSPLPDGPEHICMHFANKVIPSAIQCRRFFLRARNTCVSYARLMASVSAALRSAGVDRCLRIRPDVIPNQVSHREVECHQSSLLRHNFSRGSRRISSVRFSKSLLNNLCLWRLIFECHCPHRFFQSVSAQRL